MNVHLELIDAASGAHVASDEVPLESLPEHFEGVDTHITVGDTQYRVVGADPARRDDIAASGQVRLLLAAVPTADPRAVRFSVPTLEATAPPLGSGEDDDRAVAIHEDDWRQIELITDSQREAVDAELTEVRAARGTHEAGRGFGHAHLRRRVPAPLEGARVPLAEVIEALGVQPLALRIRGAACVADGFALPVGDALVYGRAPGGVVETLAVQGIPDDVVGALHGVALRHRLLLVEWCAARVLRAHPSGFVS